MTEKLHQRFLAGILFVSILAFFILGVLLVRSSSVKEPTNFPVVSKHVRYQFEIRNESDDFLHDVEVALFSPLQFPPYQGINEISLGSSYEDDALEQSLILYKYAYPVLAPFETKIVTVKAEVEFDPLSDNRIRPSDWLSATQFVDLNDQSIQQAALKFSGVAQEDKAYKIFDWVTTNLKPSNFLKSSKGATWALNNLTGDCTEYAYLYTALLRANSIPAIPLGGFVIARDSSVLSGVDYHNWVMFFDGEKWRLADPFNKAFDPPAEEYLAFQVVDPAIDEGLEQQRRFYTSHPRESLNNPKVLR
ncbi:transglutaminase-like domain-containing protein [Hahella ganghwensis]|uniref:transglutaminase-like domain-containing protein n=1 Tax=Hahella ganghwensis TaxID=286420 RepID=UPI00037E7D0C|nr:transglutaminase-like domain-containing protein [Hahella ganghwensis]